MLRVTRSNVFDLDMLAFSPCLERLADVLRTGVKGDCLTLSIIGSNFLITAALTNSDVL
jgi:hypothetical protein